MRQGFSTPVFSKPAALLKYFARYARRENSLATLLGLVQVAATIALAYGVARALDNALFQAEPQTPSLASLAALAAALIIRSLAAYGQTLAGNRASVKIRQALRQYALERCFALNIRLFPSFNSTQLSNVIASEIDKQRGYFADYIPLQRLAVLMPLAILIAALWVSWLVPLLFALTAPVLVLFMILVGWKASDASRDNLQQLNRLGDLLADRLKNLQALQLAQATEREADSLFQQSDQYRKSTMNVLRVAFLSSAVLEFFSAVSVALIAVYLGLFFLGKFGFGSWGELSLFAGVFLLMLAPEFYQPLRRMGNLYHQRADAVSMAEQLITLDALARSAAEQQQHEKQEQQYTNSQHTAAIATSQSLEAIHLCSGEADHPVHQPISFRLTPGQTLLLRGASGSGKTTLLDTLAGLRPLHLGSIRVNDEAHSLFQQPQWQQHIGYLSQKPELLFASIRANLCLGRHYSDEQLYAALAQARVEQVVKALPNGLDYLISDSGGFLSGGQAQRIALARIFLHRPSLLLLDEPTANLDQETASAFMEQLRDYIRPNASTGHPGAMLIMASHRSAERQFFASEIELAATTKTATGAAQ